MRHQRRFPALALLLATLAAAPSASAYVDYTPNQNLIEEVAANRFRILPRGERYALALDADFFKPVFVGGDNFTYYKWDYYHGNGYWVTARAEFKPVDRLSINLKTLITQGTSSNGPVFNALIVPLVALTYRESLFGLEWETRLSDIGRQTIGNGLFIEQKDTMGGYIKARHGDAGAALVVDGTGSFRLEGGITALEVWLWDGILGFTGLLQETDTTTQPPQLTGTIYSRRRYNNGLGYGVEVGANELNWAGLAYVTYEGWLGDRTQAGFHWAVKPQFRYYGEQVMGGLAGNVEHNYVSYEQNDKAFTNFMNIQSYGDQVRAGALQTDLEYVFNYFYRVYAETEFVHYDYAAAPRVQELFFRTGFRFYPFKEREDHFGFMIGNKYLIASSSQIDNTQSQSARTYTPPNGVDLENKPLFMKQLHVVVNYNARF